MQRADILSLSFYKTNSPFTGSEGNMRYRIEKSSREEVPILLVTVWPEPYNFETTPDEQKNTFSTSFSEEGLQNIVTWLNEQRPLYD